MAAASKPREQPACFEAEMDVFVDLATLPSYPRGAFVRGGAELLVTTSQRDLEANAPRVFTQTLRVEPSRLLAPALGAELRGVTLAVPSPSGRRMLVVRNPVLPATAPLLELWGGGRLLREVEVPPTTHGAVWSDDWFAQVSWSAGEDRVAYVAEAPPAVRTPLWGGRAPAGTPRGGDAPASGWRGQGEHVEDWGEQLSGKRTAALFVLDVPSGRVHPVRGTPEDSTCGQVAWSPDDRWLLFVAWEHAGGNYGTKRRLGAVFCYDRPCGVYCVAAPPPGSGAVTDDAPAAVCLTSQLQSAFSPRFSSCGTRLVVASAAAACATGAHNAAMALHLLTWSAAEGAAGVPQCVVPVVRAPARAGDFPGWFCAAPLARAPWVSDTEVLLATTWGSGDALVLVDVTSGAVRRITPPLADGGHWQALDVQRGLCAAVVSTPTRPPCIAVAAAPDWKWHRMQLEVPEPLSPAAEAALACLEWRIVDVPLPDRPPGSPAEVEAVLLRQKLDPGAPRPPVVLVPHGGPHTACVAGFSMPLAFLAAQGYAILQVNYRGSVGFGQDALESLLGRVGRQDVDDCLAALDAAGAAGLVDASRAAVVGGSHGGFLAAHLIGQAPTRFACAALRNPVTDLAAMVGATDIPNWCFVETAGLGARAYDDAPSPAALQAMHAVSPVAHVDAVRAPVLMLLGAKDRRVPPSNGLAYTHALRQRGVPVRLLVFPEDEHGLTKPRTELESYANILDWLRTYLPV